MNFKTIVRFAVQRVLGTFVRHSLTAFGFWLANNGIGSIDAGTQSNIEDLVIGAVCVAMGFGWSLIRSHLKSKQLETLKAFAMQFGFLDSPSKPSIAQTLKDSKPPAALNLPAVLFATFLSASMISCAVVSKFDQNTYDSALTLKSESLALLDKANEPSSQHASQIAALHVKLSAQLAYEEGKGKANVISAKQWGIILSPDHDLLGKLLEDWEEGKPFSEPYLLEKRQQISDAFDQCIRLEGAKLK